MSSLFDDRGTQMTVLGCGTMGIAILSGIFASLSTSADPASGAQTPTGEPPKPTRLPKSFVACVRRPASAKRITKELAAYTSNLKVVQDDNVTAVRTADFILLACKPQGVKDILQAEGMQEALKGKLLISICAGVTYEQLKALVPSDTSVVRAMPNTAAFVRESMTVIGTSDPPISDEQNELVKWIFTRIGRVVSLPNNLMDPSTALCGSGPAFFALVLEAMADGAVAMGLPRQEAQLMAAQTMRGTTGLVLSGEHPALVREKVSTPGGCTIGGLLELEEGRVRGAVARAVRTATVVASQLGKGAVGVNGTRIGSGRHD